MVFMMAINQIVGTGIWALLVRVPYIYPGADPVLALVIAFVPCLFFALTYAWLGSCMPRAGGDYVFISRIISPVLGYVITIGEFLARWLALGFGLIVDVGLWGVAFIILGKGTGNAGLANLGAFLSNADPMIVIAIAILLLLTMWLFVTVGGKPFIAYTAVTCFIPLIGAVIAILLNAGNPFNLLTYSKAWDAVWGTGSFNEITTIAANTGWTAAAPNFDATIRAVAGAAIYTYVGFQNPSSWAGEVKNPKRNVMIGIMGANLISAVIFIGLASTVFFSGGNFISQYAWAYYKGRGQFMITPKIEPILPLFIVLFTRGNFIIAIFIAIAGAVSGYHGAASLVMESRRVFALAFDRFFPERFANVSERFHTPTWAIAFIIVGAIVGIIISSPILGPVRSLAGGINATFMYLLEYMFTGLALAMLFIVKPEIYQSIKTGKIPIPTICGVVTFAAALLFFAVNAQTLQILDITISAIVLSVGLSLFIYYSHRNQKMGVDLKTLLSEIPPE